MKDELINEILSEWNPIDVPDNIRKTEYQSFTSLIKTNMNNEEELIACLEDILINKLELDYNKSNPTQKRDLREVAIKILSIKK